MTKQGYADITVIQDRSGSMAGKQKAVIEGFNEFLEQQKAQPGEATLSLVQFDHEYLVRFSAVPLTKAEKQGADDYVPRGSTALLDAVGRAVVETGERLVALAEDERPEHVIVVIHTDGLENCSREYTRERVKSLIEHQRKVYDWAFLFFGVGIDAFAEAGALGVDRYSTLAVNDTMQGVSQSYYAALATTSSVRAGGSAAVSMPPEESN